MRLAASLLFKFDSVVLVLRVPHRQRRAALARGQLRVIRPQFLVRGRLAVVRQIAQEQEGQHIIAEVVRVHRPAQLVSDAPEDVAQLLLILFCHFVLFAYMNCRVFLGSCLIVCLNLNCQGLLDSCRYIQLRHMPPSIKRFSRAISALNSSSVGNIR